MGMRYLQEQTKLSYKEELAPGIYSYTVQAPEIAKKAAVGQFVQVLCGEYTLRRPISLCGFSAEYGILRLVFEVRGKGTEWLANRKVGDVLDIIGPLGHGFPLLEKEKKAVLIGGGIGTPPLVPLAQHYGANAVAISGFRNRDAVILQNDFSACVSQTILCTDDGSAGFHGFTTQALEQYLQTGECDAIYTCGPKPMMKGVADIAAKQGILCYVSMEERMGCGFGACMGCSCKTKDAEGNIQMTRVCLNGPVFDAKEVDFT